MEHVIGIDLGTSNSCVAVVEGDNAVVIPDANGQRTQASIVSFFPDGRKVIGNDAREQMIYNPRNTIFSSKRLIGRPFSAPEVQTTLHLAPYRIVEGPNASVLAELFDQTYSMVDIASFILMRMKKIAEDYLGDRVSKAVITVPANFNDGQRAATMQAGERAGLSVLKVINEPTAAALAYGFGQSFDQRIVVYDFGGGTFDVTILEIKGDVFEVVSTAGDTFLGGDDIDERIVKMVVNSYRKHYNIDLRTDPIALLRVRYEAEKAKRQLSSEEQAVIRIPSLTTTEQGVIDLNVSLTRENFNTITREIIQKSFIICDEALKLAKLHAAEIENVILVGGSTHIPAVREQVEAYFGRKPYWGVNPEEVVALGAAIQGAVLAGGAKSAGGQAKDAVLLDVTSLSLGVATIGGRIERIIERNTPIPTERTRLFTTSRDGQTDVRLRIYQGESDREAENELMGILELKGLDPNSRRGEAQIEVTFEIDTNGIVQVRARDTVTGAETSAEIDLRGQAPDSEIVDMEDQDALPEAAGTP
ncbi:MAG: molecular chaperone DnaK [Myxococcales bacterium]|nr:MAG: molecular chaperone DnaK [Myxococcales bacterium]